MALWRSLLLKAKPIYDVRLYSTRNPLERRTMKDLMGSVTGGRGGRGGRGRKKGGVKGLRMTDSLKLGRGKEGIRWPGLSYPLSKVMQGKWLDNGQLDMKQVQEGDKEWDDENMGVVDTKDIETESRYFRRLSEKFWSFKGWTGRSWGGRYVGCPELPDGTPLTEFRSTVIEMKRVVNQTKGGKKRTVSCLVVVGNGNGAAGFAVGKGNDVRTAIRKAKNTAVKYLQVIPRCDGHTIYHDITTKYCKTRILMKKGVPGDGLHCQRAITAICDLVGIQDLRTKIIGSTNLLNIVRATFQGFSSQETHQDLANRTGKFLVEYRKECGFRPVVVAVPEGKQGTAIPMLKALQMLHPSLDKNNR